jgi:hypothetical protein
MVFAAMMKGVAKASLGTEWSAMEGKFAVAFCGDQGFDPFPEWMEAHDSTPMGERSTAVFVEIRGWLESSHPEVFGCGV